MPSAYVASMSQVTPGSQYPASYAQAVSAYSASPYASSQTPVSRTPAQQEAIRQQQEALAKAAELRQILNSLEKVDDEGRRSSLLDTLCSTEDVLKLPVHPSPPGIASGELTVDLLKHQVSVMRYAAHEYLTWRTSRRNKLSSGASSTKIQSYPRKRPTSRFSFGNTGRPEERYVCISRLNVFLTLVLLGLLLQQ